MSFQFNKDNIIKNPTINPYYKTKLNSIIIQLNYNDVVKDKKLLLPVISSLTSLTGQRPLVLKARTSVAAFKIRKGMDIGALVTLRKDNKKRLYKKLIVSLPKINLTKYKNLKNKSLGISDFKLFDNELVNFGANISFNFSGGSLQSHLSFLRFSLLPTSTPHF
jgi:ribosomal protein L5